MTPTPTQLALWANQVQRECLLSCADDVESGLAAAEYITSTQPFPTDLPNNIPLSFDIYNRKAQGILNRFIKQANRIIRDARKELINAINKTRDQDDNGTSIIETVNKYHNDLSKLIVDVQLTSLLAGAKQVATKARMSDENILSDEDNQILTAAAQQKAYTIASVDTQETISKIRNVLIKNNKDETDLETFQQKILDAVEQGTFLSPDHLETILRANVQSAFSEGQMSFLSRADVKERFPYVKYEAIHDDRVRDSHEALDTSGIQGTSIYRADDPVFKTFRPPWDFNCRCSWRPLTIQDAAAEGITEAEDWMLNGIEPAGTYVSQPGFQPPTNFHRDLGSYPLSIQLSVESPYIFTNISLSDWVEYTGPHGGHGWKNTSTGKVVYQLNKPGERHVRRDDELPPETSGEVDSEDRTPNDTTTSPSRQGKGIGSGNTATQFGSIKKGQSLTPDQQRQLGDIFKRIESHASTFRRAGYDDVADWFTNLIDHIKKNGLDSIATMLGESKGDISAPTNKIEYKGTGYFAEDAPKDVLFLKKYLDHAGIIFLTENENISGKRQSILTAPIDIGKKQQSKGSFKAVDTNLQSKLDESKLLPGLESSEDIETVMGKPVKAITNKVIARLDEVYGKSKWLIKSYGDESYAGFGILFPQRVKEIKRAARQVIVESEKKLNKLGYRLNRGEFKNITGVVDSQGTRYDFNTPEYAALDKKIRKIAKSAQMAAPDEKGARLPINYEDSLEQDYGISLRRDDNGKIIGITTPEGEDVDFKTKEYKKFLQNNDYDVGIEGITAHHIDRALTSAASGAGTVRFMVQPAFKAVGVTAADRALGNTWETSTEGRVHVITQEGKSSVVPYATLAARYDVMPVVFHNDDTREMEKAVQDTIDQLPESERAGQVYAPDVIKTKDGWRVVELNAASDFGQSMWLEENPLVIDSVVSHLTGREPSHVRFVRSLINDKLGRSNSTNNILPEFQGNKPRKTKNESEVQRQDDTQLRSTEPDFRINKTSGKFSVDASGHEHRGKGPGGGQFVKKGLRTNRGEDATTDKLGSRLESEKKRPKKTHPELIGKVIDYVTLNRDRARYDPKKHRKAIDIARAKAEANPAPTEEEVEYNLAKLAEMGAQQFRRGLVGNSTDRRNRRNKLLKEFGDGKTCHCIYCGIEITHGTMEQDKIYTTAQGGRYRMSNIVPACSSCNKERSDAPFDEALKMAEEYYAKRTK